MGVLMLSSAFFALRSTNSSSRAVIREEGTGIVAEAPVDVAEEAPDATGIVAEAPVDVASSCSAAKFRPTMMAMPRRLRFSPGLKPVNFLQNTFSDRMNALHCTATARILIPAECSAFS